MFSTDVDADYSLARLWDDGAEALTDGPAKPKTTYEVAEGVVGTMPFPNLGIREDMAEINADLVQPLFNEDVSQEDLEGLQSDDPETASEAGGRAIKEGITAAEFANAIRKADCRQALRILNFDDEPPSEDAIVPEMASVVVSHFTALRPGTTNGHGKS